jgi:hypothetical protein
MSFETVGIMMQQKILDFGRDIIGNLHCVLSCWILVDWITDSHHFEIFQEAAERNGVSQANRMASGSMPAWDNDRDSRRKFRRALTNSELASHDQLLGFDSCLLLSYPLDAINFWGK